ncbi:MAG: outer membrane protein assembly factor BamE [Endomicrobium sp.]|nr:outer membrane protein assembly factor BamE [Endomicrobium sp.]
MKKLIILILFLVLLGSCATVGRMNDVSVGMTKKEVLNTMGKPNTSAAKDGAEYLIYYLYETNRAASYCLKSDYFIRLVNGIVKSYGKVGYFDIPTLHS